MENLTFPVVNRPSAINANAIGESGWPSPPAGYSPLLYLEVFADIQLEENLNP
jgi:hypothetical protein